jgi:DNA-binding transcriptional ArsR family regulator
MIEINKNEGLNMKNNETKQHFEDINENNNQNNFNNEENLIEIKNMIINIHNDVKKIIEGSNQEHLKFIHSTLKNEFVNSINSYMLENVDEELDKKMINPCNMRKKCKTLFKEYLKEHIHDLNLDNISEDKINKSKKVFDELSKNKVKKNCDICFDEVSNIFETQIDLINCLKIYESYDDKDEKKISDINEENLVKSILDPISNKQRLKILKSVAIEPRTFSSLSKTTNLRGGNLLFHIQKLQNNELIFQKHEYGEYMLTKKGFNTINLLINFNK